MSAKQNLSIEFFHPRPPRVRKNCVRCVKSCTPCNRSFARSLYGAGGSTQAGTISTLKDILSEDMPAASHFSCIGATRDSMRQQLQEFKQMGVERLVALRGDLPSGYGAGGEFQYASDLVAFIRAETGDDFQLKWRLTDPPSSQITRKPICKPLPPR